MTKRSPRDFRVCKAEICDVEIPEMAAYCAAHQWMLDGWIEKSRKLLSRVRGAGQNKESGDRP